MSDAELELSSDYDEDYADFDDDDMAGKSFSFPPLDCPERALASPPDDDTQTDLTSEAGSVSDSGFSPFGTSTPASTSLANHNGGTSSSLSAAVKGKGRASLGVGGMGGEELYGQVEYRVLSLEQIEEEQRRNIAYVEDMLKLKVSSAQGLMFLQPFERLCRPCQGFLHMSAITP